MNSPPPQNILVFQLNTDPFHFEITQSFQTQGGPFADTLLQSDEKNNGFCEKIFWPITDRDSNVREGRRSNFCKAFLLPADSWIRVRIYMICKLKLCIYSPSLRCVMNMNFILSLISVFHGQNFKI